MSLPLRPRFKYHTQNTPQEIASTFKTSLKEANSIFTGSVLHYHIVIDFHTVYRKYWTPQMDLNLEDFKEGTLIRGMIGPRPNVWTKFMFFYGIAGLMMVSGIIIGTGQVSMGKSPLAFWFIPIGVLIFGGFYLLGQMGKKIAHEESVALHTFLMNHLENPQEITLDEL